MKLRYSPRALSDLTNIADFLTQRSPAGALRVSRAIQNTAELLAHFSGGGRALQQRVDVRVMPTPRVPFLIFYTIADGEVVILHIRHAARAPIQGDEL